MKELGVEIDTCLASPKVRAWDTAVLACEALGVEPVQAEALRGGDFDPQALAAGGGEVLLVGHEPDFSRAIHTETGARVDLKKGGLAALDGPTLITLLRPGQLRRLAGM